MAENTVVIYTADHGENMGEHGLWWKNCVFDTAARVPLIVRWPGRLKGGQHRAEACAHVDVVQTIADTAGARMPQDCNGDSMLGWLDHPETKWKDRAVSQYYAHNIDSGYAMIRMGQWKYVYHTPADAKHPAERELYDLKADPGELNNLAAQPEQAERIASLHAALIKEIGENPDETEQRFRRTAMAEDGTPGKGKGKMKGKKKSGGGNE
jgi:choline-sulfatase